MARQSIRVLHVEDDPIQQRLVAHHLRALAEFEFAITPVTSEAEAVRAFPSGGFRLVLLDYYLSQGNGLSCLRQIRQQDAIVPIIALSASASAAVAAELVRAGADDYIHKRELTRPVLAQSVRAALLRAEAVRQRTQPVAQTAAGAEALFLELARSFASHLAPGFLECLDRLEAAARQANLTPKQIEDLFYKVCRERDASDDITPGPARQAVRPLFLELIVRLYGDLTLEEDKDRG